MKFIRKAVIVISLFLGETCSLRAAEPSVVEPPQGFQGVESLVAVAPSDKSLKRGTKVDPVVIGIINAAFRDKLIGQHATFTFRVAKANATTSSKQPLVIVSRTERVSLARTKVPFTVFAYVLADQLPALGQLKEGGSVTVSGRIIKAQIAGDSTFVVDLYDTTVTPR